MAKVFFLKGLPGSGKSTWALEYMKSKSTVTVKRVNKDLLREMLDGGRWSKNNENFVVEARDFLIQKALACGNDVVVDDTNFAPVHEKEIQDLATTRGHGFEVKFFDTPVEECIRRDAKREKPVGRKVIMDMYTKYLAQPAPKYVTGLPNAIICDLDGTLAIHFRGPYEIEKCDTDAVNEPVAGIVNSYQDLGHSVLFVSGRSDVVYAKTLLWLKDHGLWNEHGDKDRLFMRAGADSRPDNVVKQELYEAYIKGKYNILFVLDDRQRVVDMWRRNGLTCLQVAEGDF